MTLMDIINPWGALRRERRLFVTTVADYENAHLRSEDALRMVRQRLETREETLISRIGVLKGELLLCKIRCDTLQRTIAQGHFRNPETGRIGPKGVTYS